MNEMRGGPRRVFPLGVVGLGAMGLPLARTLAGDRSVIAYDADPAARDRADEAGVPVAASLAALAQECRVVLLSLPSTYDVEQVVREVVSAAPGRLLLGTGDVTPEETRRIAALALAAGATYLDTPVTGTPETVGDWTVSMGGPSAAYAVVADTFETVARSVVHVGPVGSAAATRTDESLPRRESDLT